MKKISSFFITVFAISINAQTNKAAFDYFEYKGNDTLFNISINPTNQYLNPILAGFYPDPSICRKGKDYYLVNSSFSYFPGIPIWHSKDLVSWQQIGHVLDRPSQLKLDGLDLSAGIYAPTIRYDKITKTFYLICTVVGGINNFIVKTQNPSQGWSEPIPLPQIKGIDPSLFFDDNGKTYIIHCGQPKVAQWRGHKAIWLNEYDTKTDKIIGEGKIIVDGGVDTSKHPLWLEGPHIYKVKNKYYLIAAEGGTSEGHSQVAFESNAVNGTYKPCATNPILTQRDLPDNRTNRVTSTGHADLIKTHRGEWFVVFLATRPYAESYYNTGRETFLLPVEWKNNTPIILKKSEVVPIVVKKKRLDTSVTRPTGNFFWKDDFRKPILGFEWNMLRTASNSWYAIENGELILNAIDKSIYDKVNPSFLGRRQQHTTFTAKTAFTFEPKTDNELAGMVLFQNDKNNIVIGKTIKAGKAMIVVQNRKNGKNELISEVPIEFSDKTINFSIDVDKNLCTIYYSYNQHQPIILAQKLDVKHLSTKVGGGFVGSYIGIYATSTFNN